jgi:hypothetical protein
MRLRTTRPVSVALLSQAAICLFALTALTVAPPARGAMLLVPLLPERPIVRIARGADALIVGRGPAGAVMVRGDRAALFWPLLAAGVLPLAAPAAYCGGAA